jgi:RimJ/RimL family protein N-acetyltransferase
MPWCHPDYSIEETRTWVESRAEAWEAGKEYDFAIFEAGMGKYLGGCGLNNIDNTNRIANLGYWVRTSRTKKGIATAATRLLTKYGIENLKLNRIEILVAIDNKQSQRVAEKAVATREGILRNRITIHEKVFDAMMFSFIPGDMK